MKSSDPCCSSLSRSATMVLVRTAVRQIRDRSQKKEGMHLLLPVSSVSSVLGFRAEPRGRRCNQRSSSGGGESVLSFEEVSRYVHPGVKQQLGIFLSAGSPEYFDF